ncbi:hypothetical protein [Neobacillus sp. PS3-40]|uniref:hypothetical protein n=1 Tax=Neobacillus sp. PS3-40 TaxID=3070679 RepID=UPI0027E1B290|nr:hypothetical protein [Neobacillus sp. PS3-40]WML43295.1 hypothetical protein RCG20_16055 [Neobacillus sp. PS3-40]
MMKEVTVGIFLISVLLFFWAVHFLLKFKKSGVYPPKKVLKKRAFAFAVEGAIFQVLGFLFSALSS